MQVPTVLVVDNIYQNPDSTGANGLRAISHSLHAIIKNPEKIITLQGFQAFIDYVSNHSLEQEDNLVLLVHESFNMDRRQARETQERESVAQVSETVRDRNFRARIIVYGFGSNLPLPAFIKDAEADAIRKSVVLTEDFEEILFRGQVSDEEIKERGKTIEIIGRNQRISWEGVEMRIRLHREREGD